MDHLGISPKPHSEIGRRNTQPRFWDVSARNSAARLEAAGLGLKKNLDILGVSQWMGLRENLQENSVFNGKITMFSCRFSLKPVHWVSENVESLYDLFIVIRITNKIYEIKKWDILWDIQPRIWYLEYPIPVVQAIFADSLWKHKIWWLCNMLTVPTFQCISLLRMISLSAKMQHVATGNPRQRGGEAV